MPQAAQVAIDRIRTITGDINKAQFTDQEVINWLNDAQWRLLGKTYGSQDHFVLTSVKGQANYGLPPATNPTPSSLFVRQVWYGEKLISPTSVEEISKLYPNNVSGQNNSTLLGTPQWYWIDSAMTPGWNLQLFPVPDTDGILITGIKVNSPGKITAVTDLLSCTDEQLETLVLMCLQRAKEWDMDYEGARYFDTITKERMAEDMHNNAVRFIEVYPHVREADGDLW